MVRMTKGGTGGWEWNEMLEWVVERVIVDVCCVIFDLCGEAKF
jgi:hypothetical protein